MIESRRPGAVLLVLDSVHTQEHVTEELRLYTPLLAHGDALVVEDTDHNGHPVLSDYGPSAWEAVEEFMAGDSRFAHWEVGEMFGKFTNSPNGWLICK